MKVAIQDAKTAAVRGVRFSRKDDCAVYREDYFACTPLPLITQLQNTRVVCGVLEGWHHTPIFRILETHQDAETFYYFEGVALMPFCDMVNGKPDLKTAQVIRIEAGTQVEVAGGKAHFVAVAEGDRFRTVVYCPQQSADRVTLEEAIEGY